MYSDSNSSDEDSSSSKQTYMHTLSNSDSESCDVSIGHDEELNRKHWQKQVRGKIINMKMSIYMCYLLVTKNMRQTTKYAKSDHSDEEDFPPNKLESIDEHTSLDIDLRPLYNISSSCDKECANGRSYGRKGMSDKGISYNICILYIYIYIYYGAIEAG